MKLIKTRFRVGFFFFFFFFFFCGFVSCVCEFFCVVLFCFVLWVCFFVFVCLFVGFLGEGLECRIIIL